MFKQIAVFSLLLMYLGTTVGFAMSLHFCGSKISDIRINQDSQKPCCGNETNSKADTCCKDQQIKIKVSDQQQTIQSVKIPAVINLNLFIIPLKITNSISSVSVSDTQSSYRGPRVISDIPFTIQNCIFRI